MSIYDLRYISRPQWTSTESTRPYLDFSKYQDSDRHGLGFDYDPDLGLIASGESVCVGTSSEGQERKLTMFLPRQASANGLSNNTVLLFSARSGKVIDSRLNKHHFISPVTCIRFARTRSTVTGELVPIDNEPKSVLIAAGCDVDEGSWQGLGFEQDDQE